MNSAQQEDMDTDAENNKAEKKGNCYAKEKHEAQAQPCCIMSRKPDPTRPLHDIRLPSHLVATIEYHGRKRK